MSESTRRRRPDWEHAGGVATMDAGQFAAVVGAARELHFTPVQLDAVRDVLHRARAEGADEICLDPTAPASVRLPAFAAILRPAIARGEIPGVSMSDTATLAALFDLALGWGPLVQPILDDVSVSELKLIGRTALAEGLRGRIRVADAYADVAEPGSRVRALAQLIGVTWDAAHPSVTIPLANKTRMHATSAPLVAEGDQLIIFRRGRSQPWTLADQVARQSLDEPAAALLRALLQAQPSVLVSGAQNAGKTTVLECALNELPANLHLVLVEDNTDEFSLRTPLVTRLRVPAGPESYATIVRETLRMTPDLLVPGEIRGAEAGAIAQMAEAGRPTLTTIHARTPQAALQRFARLAASDIPGNSFARQPEAALRVICESFQLVIHAQYLRRLQRRIVRFVGLLDGLDEHGQVRLHPLIEAVLDAEAAGGVRWECHATVAADGRLLWVDGQDRTPPALAEALADVPDSGAGPRLIESSARSVSGMLEQVRELLPYDEQARAIGQLLNAVRELDPENHGLWSVAERVLASNRAAAAETAAIATTATVELESALARRELDLAADVVGTARQNVLVWVALHQSPAWVEAYATYETLRALVEDVTVALAEARQLTLHGDIPAALRRLQGFHAPSLPVEPAREILAARIGLLTAQQRMADPVSAQAIAQQLRILGEQQQRLDDVQLVADLAPAAVTEAQRPVSDQAQPFEEEAPVQAVAPATPAEDAPQAVARADEPTIVKTLAELDELPIRTRSAADVGDGSWAALFSRERAQRD